MRIIFVPVANRPECALALQVAFGLARELGASLDGCHIRPHSNSRVKLPAMTEHEVSWEAAWRDGKKPKNSAGAKDLFARTAESHGFHMIKSPHSAPGALWVEKVGSPDKVLAISGPVSDLIVVSRPARKGGNIARLFMMAALFNSSRPVLILPHSGKPAIGKRICIAWNQSSEAARAVAAAMPLLRLADQVSIVTCGAESGIGPKASQLSTYLRFWGVKADRVNAGRGDESKGLVKAYHDTGSDLMVMGAYSHSRLREQIFGGVTDFMLNRADIPVLMLHT